MTGNSRGIGAIARSYAAKSREEWYGEWGAALLYRPLSFLLTPLFLRLSIGATTVTVAALALVLCLPLLALRGSPVEVGLLAILIAVLDCVDGNIARATGTTSKLGHYLDFLTDILFRIALYGSIGALIDADRTAPGWIAGWGLLLCIAAAFLAVAARLCRIYAERFAGEVAYARPEGEDRRSGGILRFAFPFVSGIDPLLPLVVFATGWIGGLHWVAAWLLGYSALDFLYTQYAVLRRLA
jgi:phosphatidylglycerophosphate synthase